MAVTSFERAGRRRSGLREAVEVLDAVPELRGRELLLVDELLAPEPDRERDDLDAQRLHEMVGEIAGAVGHDTDTHISRSRSAGGDRSGPARCARRVPAARTLSGP